MDPVERPLLPPEKLKSQPYPSHAAIHQLARELKEAKVSEQAMILFARLAALRPERRLAHNLSTLASLMCQTPVYNILTEGLTPEEHAALVELDLHVLSISAREAAHGLLNVHERWCVAKELRRIFKQAANSEGGFIVVEGASDPLSTGHIPERTE